MFCLHLWFGEHGHDMMGHEMVNGDLTGYTIHDTTNGGWRLLAFTLIYPCKIEPTLFTFIATLFSFPTISLRDDVSISLCSLLCAHTC